VLGGLGGVQYVRPNREIDLAIAAASGGPSETVRLRAALAPLDWPARIVLLANTVVGLLIVASAFQLVWTQPSRMTWGFFLYVAWFNPGQTYAYYTFLQSSPIAVLAQEFAEAVAQGAAYGGLLVFALRFPTGSHDERWRRTERAAPWIGAIVALLTLLSAANLFGLPTERITEAAFLSGYVVDALVIFVLLRRRRQVPPQEEQRMRWAIAGCAIGLPAFIFAEICQSSGLLYDLWGVAPSQVAVGFLYLLSGVLAYFVGTAVRRRRVVNVAIPLRHGTITTALMLILGVPIVYLHETVAKYEEGLHAPEWVWLLILAPVVLALFNRLHEIGVELIDHVFSHHYHRLKERFHEVGRSMVEAGSFAAVDRLLVDEPVSALGLSSAAVFRLMDGELRRADPAIGWDGASVRELHSADLDALQLQGVDLAVPVRLARGQWQRPGLPADDCAPCLAVPVSGGAKECVAVVLYGPHEIGTDINSDERAMLRELAIEAGSAYDRVETEALRREVRDLQAQVAALQSARVGNPAPAGHRY
jgi:hypothetical protein